MYVIDVAISGDRHVIKKEAEKILKFKDLAIKTQRMWNVKTKVIPVITPVNTQNVSATRIAHSSSI